MKILLTRSLLPVDLEYIRTGLDRRIAGQYEFLIPAEYTEAAIAALAPQADVLLGPYVTPAILRAAAGLRLIQVPWTGLDTFDFSAMHGFDVPVCNSHSNAQVVAEMGLALLLDLLKKVSYHDAKMRAFNWNRDQQPLDLKSRMLSQQRVCVLGYGAIGSRVGRLCQAFGAEVSAVDAGDRKWDGVTVYPPQEMMTAAAQADVVVVTLPLTESTRGLVDADFLRRLRPGAMLVLLSRAGIVDEDALWDALQSGQLAGYASDVWWRAPRRGESSSHVSDRHPFETLPQVVLSPHRAGFSENSLPHLDDVIENLSRLALGEPLINQVSIKEAY